MKHRAVSRSGSWVWGFVDKAASSESSKSSVWNKWAEKYLKSFSASFSSWDVQQVTSGCSYSLQHRLHKVFGDSMTGRERRQPAHTFQIINYACVSQWCQIKKWKQQQRFHIKSVCKNKHNSFISSYLWIQNQRHSFDFIDSLEIKWKHPWRHFYSDITFDQHIKKLLSPVSFRSISKINSFLSKAMHLSFTDQTIATPPMLSTNRQHITPVLVPPLDLRFHWQPLELISSLPQVA